MGRRTSRAGGAWRPRRHIIALAVVGVATLVTILAVSGRTPTGTAGEDTIVLSYSFFAPSGTFPAVQMERWAQELERRTNGLVRVNTFPGGTLLGAENTFDGVLDGVADIGLSVPSYEPGRFPLLAIADLPVGFPDARTASITFWDLIEEFQPPSLSEFKIITAFTGAPSYIQSTSPVRDARSLQGRVLRVPGTSVPVLAVLGASPVGMPMSAVAEALHTGVIQGYVAERGVLRDLRFAETVKYITDYPIFTVAFLAVMDLRVWERLPGSVQQAIDDLGRETAIWTGEYLDNHVDDVLAWAHEEEGVRTVSLAPEERARWDARLAEIRERTVQEAEAAGHPARRFVDRLYELRDTHGAHSAR